MRHDLVGRLRRLEALAPRTPGPDPRDVLNDRLARLVERTDPADLASAAAAFRVRYGSAGAFSAALAAGLDTDWLPRGVSPAVALAAFLEVNP